MNFLRDSLSRFRYYTGYIFNANFSPLTLCVSHDLKFRMILIAQLQFQAAELKWQFNTKVK